MAKKKEEFPHALVNIPVKDISPSATNPRKDFDAKELTDLCNSILKQGILQPIVVRPTNKAGKYELVCGERRWRACGMAELATIPAVVRTLTDDEAFDFQITENLQRKDVHPMEEANAFQQLIDKKGNSVAKKI